MSHYMKSLSGPPPQPPRGSRSCQAVNPRNGPVARLDAMNVLARSPASLLPWSLVLSFARAIKQPALEIWQGNEARGAAAKDALRHRAHCNHAGLQGEYSAAMERT